MFFLKACARNLGFTAILIFFVARRRAACASKKMIIAAALRLNPKLLFKKNKKNNQQPIPLAPLGGTVGGLCLLALFVVWRRLYSGRAFAAMYRFLVCLVCGSGLQLKKNCLTFCAHGRFWLCLVFCFANRKKNACFGFVRLFPLSRLLRLRLGLRA